MKKENTEADVYLQAGICLRNLIRENGTEILTQPAELGERLQKGNCDRKIILQILLLLQASNFLRYIPQKDTGISMVDVNNICSCAERETGMDKKTVRNTLIAVLYGLSVPTELASVSIVSEKNVQRADRAIVSDAGYIEELEDAEQAVLNRDEEALTRHLPALNLLADAGYPDALYLKGLCYWHGVGVPSDSILANRYLETASAGGSPKAAALLGDFHFQAGLFRDYTKAFRYYTVLGAVALSEERKKKVEIILQEKNVHFRFLLMNAVFLVALIVFNMMLGAGVFSVDGASHWFWGIFSSGLSACAFGAAVYYFITHRYSTVKILTPVLFIITVLCALFAL